MLSRLIKFNPLRLFNREINRQIKPDSLDHIKKFSSISTEPIQWLNPEVMKIVHCKGLEKATVFAALVDNASPKGSSILDYKHCIINQQEAEYHLGQQTKFEAVNGRQINVDFSQYPYLNESEYDEMYGKGKMDLIVFNLRRGVRTYVIHHIEATKNHNEIIPYVAGTKTLVTYVKGRGVNYELSRSKFDSNSV